MRVHVGAVPESPDFLPDIAPWRSLREPGPIAMQFIALPIGIAAGAIMVLFWARLTPPRQSLSFTPFSIAATFVVVIPVHELIHALVHPASGRSRNSIVGVWPSRFLFYAHYDGELTRNRFLAILLMPFLVISVAPALFAHAFLDVAPAWLAFASILNALLACGDLLGVLLVAFQVPRAATIRNQGWRTYWKPAGGREQTEAREAYPTTINNALNLPLSEPGAHAASAEEQ